jgi:hypothetical protein
VIEKTFFFSFARAHSAAGDDEAALLGELYETKRPEQNRNRPITHKGLFSLLTLKKKS